GIFGDPSHPPVPGLRLAGIVTVRLSFVTRLFSSSSDRFTAIDVENSPRDPTRLRRKQVSDRRGDILRRAKTQRVVFLDAGAPFVEVRTVDIVHRRQNAARADAIGANAVTGVLGCESAGEGNDTGLRRGVARNARSAGVNLRGRDGDDAAVSG